MSELCEIPRETFAVLILGERGFRNLVLSKVGVPERPDGCWPWLARRNKDGYGVYTVGRSATFRAHRLVYAYFNFYAPCPPNLQLDHLCSNPPCVNPAHLEPVTQIVNMRRSLDRRLRAGQKLFWAQVAA